MGRRRLDSTQHSTQLSLYSLRDRATETFRHLSLIKKTSLAVFGGLLLAGAPVAALALHNPTGDASAVPLPNFISSPADTGTETPDDTPAASSDQPDDSNQNSNSTNITINGQSVPVPENGTSSQTITTNDNDNLNVSVEQHTSSGNATSTNHSSSNISITSHSSGSQTTETEVSTDIQP